MHEMINRIVGSRYIDDPRLDAEFIHALHDGVREIYGGLLFGLGHERAEQHEQIAQNPLALGREFRQALKKVFPKVGPRETTMTSETNV